MRAAVLTAGCRLNQAESDGLRAWLRQEGWTVGDGPAGADVCYVNTCAVTGRAERSSIQLIRQACRTRPKPKVVVLGCLAESAPERVWGILGVNEVWSREEKQRAVDESCPWPERSRALLKVQDGCSRRCHFCLAALVRGEPKSLPVGQVLERFVQLVDAGYQEIVLTGLNLGCYQVPDGTDLAGLLKRLLALPGRFRIRLGSLEPDAFKESLWPVLADGRICPHFHIPLQSGDDKLLSAMGRHLPAASGAAVVERLVRLRPDACIGADVIVGFPGENEASFLRTEQFLDSLPLAYLHVFSYSPRPGTTGYCLGEGVRPAVKRERVARLREFSARRRRQFGQRFVGTCREAVLETGQRALTDNYLRLRVSAAGLLPKSLFRAFIADAKSAGLLTERRRDAVIDSSGTGHLLVRCAAECEGVLGWLH
ncbi:MAG: MiaB/RimO family radical SAM methylthiotransferase [candidate division WOR-3 bacterium]